VSWDRSRSFYGGAGVKGLDGVTIGIMVVVILFCILVVLGAWATQ